MVPENTTRSMATTARRLQHLLGSSYYVVYRPDHPHLLRSPTLLVAGEGKLTVVIRVTRSTTRTQLHSLIASSRLALPTTARMLAVLETGTERIATSIAMDVDEVLLNSSTLEADVAKFCKGDVKSVANAESLIHIKWRHYVIFSTALQMTILRSARKKQVVDPDAVFDSLFARSPTEYGASLAASWRQRRTLTLGYSKVFSVRGKPDRPFSADFRSIWSAQLDNNYVLDNGVPFPRSRDGLDIVLVADIPHDRFDRNKPTRVAAFAGCIVAEATTTEDVVELSDRSSEVLRERLRGRP